MSVKTYNTYGRISITESAIAQVAGCAALGCYGAVGLSSGKIIDTFNKIFKNLNRVNGVAVTAKGNRIYIELSVLFKYGVNISAVAYSLKKTVQYEVEKFSGMIVECINVTVLDIKI